MRCKNCGWPNEDNVTRCIKCNSPLGGSLMDNNNGNHTVNQGGGHISGTDNPDNLKATLRDCAGGNGNSISSDNNNNQAGSFCSRCGYPVGTGMDVCPSCGTPVAGANNVNRDANQGGGQSPFGNPFGNHAGGNHGGQQQQGGQRFAGGTINPWSHPQGNDGFCQLKRIPWQNENVNYDPISYSGTEIVLNRANTDPNNSSITSQQQAVIIRDGEDWYLEDRSALKTTLIRAGRPIKLEDGDIIVMGNRMFEFHK